MQLYFHWLLTFYTLWTASDIMLDTRVVLTTCAQQHFNVADHQSDCKLKNAQASCTCATKLLDAQISTCLRCGYQVG